MFRFAAAAILLLVAIPMEAQGQRRETLQEDRVRFTCESSPPLFVRWDGYGEILTNRDEWRNPGHFTRVTRAVVGRNHRGSPQLECHYTYQAWRESPPGYTCEVRGSDGFICTQRTRRRDFRD
jgi:hypothetical protein